MSGSGQHDHWPRLRGALQAGFNSTRNPHMQNIRYNRVFCISFFRAGQDLQHRSSGSQNRYFDFMVAFGRFLILVFNGEVCFRCKISL